MPQHCLLRPLLIFTLQMSYIFCVWRRGHFSLFCLMINTNELTFSSLGAAHLCCVISYETADVICIHSQGLAVRAPCIAQPLPALCFLSFREAARLEERSFNCQLRAGKGGFWGHEPASWSCKHRSWWAPYLATGSCYLRVIILTCCQVPSL